MADSCRVLSTIYVEIFRSHSLRYAHRRYCIYYTSGVGELRNANIDMRFMEIVNSRTKYLTVTVTISRYRWSHVLYDASIVRDN